ncbi:hypothetical protein lerEdw1_014343 [Lerista edwardsae]|nr:hypothetical protein lerEdw1_014345 [Lerista edwardsae]KAJ6633642.1 hypothetical protein lerEdw1_014343 [Lerista edwardsae]
MMRLMGLRLILLCSVLAVDSSDASNLQLTGTWYANAIATRCEDILDFKDNLKTMVASIDFTEDGSLEIGVNIPLPGGCQKISMNFQKKDSGHYFHESDWGEYTVEDFETDYKNWFAVKTKHETKSETCEMFAFYSRERIMTNEEKNSFMKFCMHNGYNQDDIIFMPPEGRRCSSYTLSSNLPRQRVTEANTNNFPPFIAM